MPYSKDVPWARWYGLNRWRRRSKLQLQQFPICAMCERQGKVEAATISDHIEPHRGDQMKFFYGALQSLCLRCHLTVKAQEEGRAKPKDFVNDIGTDGWPIDLRHEVYRVREQ